MATTPAEVAALVEGRRVIRCYGDCFVNVRDTADATRFGELGATVRQGEIHLASLLPEPEPERDGNGELVLHDDRKEVMLAYFRERDGDTRPWWAR